MILQQNAEIPIFPIFLYKFRTFSAKLPLKFSVCLSITQCNYDTSHIQNTPFLIEMQTMNCAQIKNPLFI